MKEYEISQRKGKHCVIMGHPDDSNKILKVFTAYPQKDWEGLEEMRWGDLPARGQPSMSVKLIEATKIQNICWMHDLAPRVYEIVRVTEGKYKYYAQVIEDLGDNHAESQDKAQEVYNKVKELGKIYGFGNEKDDVSTRDVMQGMLVDFNTFHFKEGYLDKVKDKYCEYAKYGDKIYYHPISEWGLTGSPRKVSRFEQMGLDKIDFKNMNVLDLGCAGGMVCRYAKDRGASSVLGIDYPGCGTPDPIKGAYLSSNMLGYWDINYLERDMTKWSGNYLPKADIVLYLSINYHIGIPEWLPRVTEEVCIFEDNSKNRDAKAVLEKMFRKVEYIGGTTDHATEDNPKLIYHCYK